MADSGAYTSGALSSSSSPSSSSVSSVSSSSPSSSSSSSSASASSEDAAEPPRSRLSRLAATLAEQSPLLPPLIDMSELTTTPAAALQRRHRSAGSCADALSAAAVLSLHRVLSFLSPDRLVIADGAALSIFSLSGHSPLKAKRAEADVRQSGSGSVPRLHCCCPLLLSCALKSPTQLLHLHDGRVCTKAAGEKVVRLHSAMPPLLHAASLPALAASASSSLLHLRHERPSPVVSALLSLDAHRLLVGFTDGALQLYNSRTGARYGVSTGCGILALIPVSTAFAASASTSSIIVSSRAIAVAAASSASSSTASPSVSHVIAYTADRTFRLVDLQLGRIARYIGRIPFATRVFTLDADCRVAVTGEHSVFLYRLDTWTCQATLSHDEEMRQEAAAAAAGSGSTASDSRSSHDWQEEKKDDTSADSSGWPSPSQYGASCLVALPPPPRQPTFACALWSPFLIATGNSAGFLHVHSARPSSPQHLLCSATAHGAAVCHLLYAREGRIVSCGVEGAVRLWQLETQRTDAAGKSKWRGVTGDESESAAEEEEEASSWRLRLLCEYAVQEIHSWCGSVLFLPGC